MWRSIWVQAEHVFSNMFSLVVWVISFVMTSFLSAIGYPKHVLSMIFWLIIIDIITKLYSVVKVHYGSFSIKLLLYKGWSDRVLTSRILKDGLGVKAMLYTPVLYIAHQLTLTSEVIGGVAMSNVLYSVLVLVEIISILENFDDAGHRNLSPILNFLKSKKVQILGDTKEGEKNGSKSK